MEAAHYITATVIVVVMCSQVCNNIDVELVRPFLNFVHVIRVDRSSFVWCLIDDEVCVIVRTNGNINDLVSKDRMFTSVVFEPEFERLELTLILFLEQVEKQFFALESLLVNDELKERKRNMNLSAACSNALWEGVL